jgi:hypothetical protein
MIDTDKYEGHTEGPWELITNYSEEDWDNKWVGSVHLFTTLGISFDVVGVNETDVQLMADAPLLLQEVKRLREAMKTMLDDMNNASPEEDIDYWLDTWKHWLKEMIK